MKWMGKGSALLACLCLLPGAAFAQKNASKIVKALSATPRPPLLAAGRAPVAHVLQQNLMQGWNLALGASLERSVLQRVSPLTDATVPASAIYATEKLRPIQDYLTAHQNQWPEYGNSTQANRVLRYISNFMEVEEPSAEVLELQRAIIRLRAASQARSPYELVRMVGTLMTYGMVPSRAKLGDPQTEKNAEEMALGEELAFAMAANKVPMRANPWKKISGFTRMMDQVNTYQAMRRQDKMLDGIPETYEGEGKIHYPNIPLLTQKQYVAQQQKFAAAHPFEYALAPFWEKIFSRSFYRVFNKLSPVEKQALLFTAPALPQTVDMTADSFTPYYDSAVLAWMEQNGREPKPYTGPERTKQLEQFLTGPVDSNPTLRFWVNGNLCAFIDLSNAQQVEVLMWTWKHLNLPPGQALERFEADKGDFF